MRIGELSRRSGLPRDTLRYYEREGLICSEPSIEPSNTYRRYRDETVERLKMIAEAREAGFSVVELRDLFAGLDGMATSDFDAQGFLEKKIADLRAQIERSRRLIVMLNDAKNALASASRNI